MRAHARAAILYTVKVIKNATDDFQRGRKLAASAHFSELYSQEYKANIELIESIR